MFLCQPNVLYTKVTHTNLRIAKANGIILYVALSEVIEYVVESQ